MNLIELILIAVGLSMDAFAVSICKGISIGKATIRDAVIVGLFFGGFQAIMPIIGYYIGESFHGLIESFSYIIAAALLIILGLRMIKESREEKEATKNLDFKNLILLSIATSIDSLAVGISLSLTGITLLPAVVIIGLVTFIISFIGVKSGSFFGMKFQSGAEIFGGIILILIGLKVLLEGLGAI